MAKELTVEEWNEIPVIEPDPVVEVVEKKPEPSETKVRVELTGPPSSLGQRQRKRLQINYEPLTELNEKIVEASVVMPLGTTFQEIAEKVKCGVNAVTATFKKRAAHQLRIQLLVQTTGFDALQVEHRIVRAGIDDDLRTKLDIPWREVRQAAKEAASRAGHDAAKIFIEGNESDLEELGM